MGMRKYQYLYIDIVMNFAMATAFLVKDAVTSRTSRPTVAFKESELVKPHSV